MKGELDQFPKGASHSSQFGFCGCDCKRANDSRPRLSFLLSPPFSLPAPQPACHESLRKPPKSDREESSQPSRDSSQLGVIKLPISSYRISSFTFKFCTDISYLRTLLQNCERKRRMQSTPHAAYRCPRFISLTALRDLGPNAASL